MPALGADIPEPPEDLMEELKEAVELTQTIRALNAAHMVIKQQNERLDTLEEKLSSTPPSQSIKKTPTTRKKSSTPKKETEETTDEDE